MAKCSECRKSFRVPEDEQDGSHPCPFCGYDGYEPDTREEPDYREDDEDDIRESLHDHIGAYGEHGRESYDEGTDDGE